MPWKITESDDENALTDSELIAISVLLAQNLDDDDDVFFHAWRKIQNEVNVAIRGRE